MVDGPRRGQAYAYFAVASGLLTLPAGLIAGALWDRSGARAAFMFGSALAIVATAALLLPIYGSPIEPATDA
ncbi:MAG: transporter [Acidimicrobiia bacterium]|nr:transporter [Acidimicrobiia bacterium]